MDNNDIGLLEVRASVFASIMCNLFANDTTNINFFEGLIKGI